MAKKVGFIPITLPDLMTEAGEALAALIEEFTGREMGYMIMVFPFDENESKFMYVTNTMKDNLSGALKKLSEQIARDADAEFPDTIGEA